MLLGFKLNVYDFELLILLLIPSQCWYSMHVPPHPIYIVLGIEPRALCMLHKVFINSPSYKPQPRYC